MNSRKIILADRDTKLLNDISHVLNDAGYTVYCAGDKETAISICTKHQPDLGIFEASKDESCCIEIASELYQFHNTPFISISDYDDPETINKAIAAGALSYLVKPLHEKLLLPVIESSLHRAQDIRELQNTEENLSKAIQTARTISAAIGILMERFQLTNRTAFEILRAEARANQKKVMDIANEILTAVETINQFNRKNKEC